MIWHPYSIQKTKYSNLKIAKAKEEFLYDEAGKAYIDAVASWWVSIHGHNHPKILESIYKQLHNLDHVILAGFSHEAAENLAKKTLEITKNTFRKVFYSDNGSCANEIAVKIAYQYHINSGDTKRKKFIRFSASYHGDTIGTMSLSGSESFHGVFKDMLLPVKEFISADCYSCPLQKSRENCELDCLQNLKTYLETDGNTVAAIIIEPIVQAACGFKFYKKEILQEIDKLCRQYGIVFILDEVFTGFGRLGENFAYEYANVSPDILTLAKAFSGGVLPIAATLVNEKIYEAFYSEEPEKAFYHGHTMTGNPPSAAAALSSLELYEKENRLLEVRNLEKVFAKKLKLLQEKFPDRIEKLRVLGAIACFNLKTEDSYTNPIGKEFAKTCLEKGVILRPLGNVVYITPPYIIKEESIEQIFEAIEYSLTNL
ncbi:MAG: adenosylmethionine--8-amino-7-oxononanoate transaminase [Leptospiraceae bacterium]|nr:adenosylmethionine--8-amino-7-oxononanoate transaminase [Leptospiraceae bacterium]MCP5499735.1 adenosylmethionine--8-amino-7-oxononanoate transaminase [Leptospiraceae bacterium]